MYSFNFCAAQSNQKNNTGVLISPSLFMEMSTLGGCFWDLECRNASQVRIQDLCKGGPAEILPTSRRSRGGSKNLGLKMGGRPPPPPPDPRSAPERASRVFFNSSVTCFTNYGQSPINVASYNRLWVNLDWYSAPKVGGLCGYLVYLQKGNWVIWHDAI